MSKDLTDASVDRQNILNNPLKSKKPLESRAFPSKGRWSCSKSRLRSFSR